MSLGNGLLKENVLLWSKYSERIDVVVLLLGFELVVVDESSSNKDEDENDEHSVDVEDDVSSQITIVSSNGILNKYYVFYLLSIGIMQITIHSSTVCFPLNWFILYETNS